MCKQYILEIHWIKACVYRLTQFFLSLSLRRVDTADVELCASGFTKEMQHDSDEVHVFLYHQF